MRSIVVVGFDVVRKVGIFERTELLLRLSSLLSAKTIKYASMAIVVAMMITIDHQTMGRLMNFLLSLHDSSDMEPDGDDERFDACDD